MRIKCEENINIHCTFFFVLNEAILKDSDYSEVDRAECQFTTTATVLDNGTQVCSFLISESFMSLFSYDIKLISNQHIMCGKAVRLKLFQESVFYIIAFLYNQLYENQFIFGYFSWEVVLR